MAPLIIVNGPIAKEIGINGGYNAFGQGFRANLTIGRAVRLLLMNVGGGLPGTGDRATQGTPAKIAYCVAENEAANPWEPLHVEHGFAADASTVTAIACEGPHNIQDHFSYTGLGILRSSRVRWARPAATTFWPAASAALRSGPSTRATVARDGISKRQVKEFLFERARFRSRDGRRVPQAPGRARSCGRARNHGAGCSTADEDISVIVMGGAGKHSSWQPTFGDQTWPARRAITRTDGTPLKSVAELTPAASRRRRPRISLARRPVKRVVMGAPPTIERRPLLATPLADWRTTKVDVRAIRFGPGQATGIHSHPCHVVGYIAEGAVILEIAGQPEQRLETGAAFHEPAGVRILRFDMPRASTRSNSSRCTCCRATSR